MLTGSLKRPPATTKVRFTGIKEFRHLAHGAAPTYCLVNVGHTLMTYEMRTHQTELYL